MVADDPITKPVNKSPVQQPNIYRGKAILYSIDVRKYRSNVLGRPVSFVLMFIAQPFSVDPRITGSDDDTILLFPAEMLRHIIFMEVQIETLSRCQALRWSLVFSPPDYQPSHSAE